jgi:hypothetical protein
MAYPRRKVPQPGQPAAKDTRGAIRVPGRLAYQVTDTAKACGMGVPLMIDTAMALYCRTHGIPWERGNHVQQIDIGRQDMRW